MLIFNKNILRRFRRRKVLKSTKGTHLTNWQSSTMFKWIVNLNFSKRIYSEKSTLCAVLTLARTPNSVSVLLYVRAQHWAPQLIRLIRCCMQPAGRRCQADSLNCCNLGLCAAASTLELARRPFSSNHTAGRL